MSQPEILAPAGSMESLVAALRCGADAVYAGGTSFSARQSAENFDMATLYEAIRLCHLYGAKFYLAANTLLFDKELSQFESFLRETVAAGIDAILLQDFGALWLVRALFPDLPIHASTQMTIHTPTGAVWAKEHGITRVVAARELSRNEIKAMCDTGVEIEQFVHGALCMSVSGQCNLSAMIGSRSANRGRCAQACRLPFSVGKQPYALSLKDLCLVPNAAQMEEDGVVSLKIEGRCKRPEYVAAAVTALRQALDGLTPDLKTLQAVFSRSGFTDGYYTGKRQALFGFRRKEDVEQAKYVLPQLRNSYHKPRQIITVEMHVIVRMGLPVTLQLTDSEGTQVTVTGDPPQFARQHPTDNVQLAQQLGKLGGTIFRQGSLTADCDGIGMLPAARLNQLRRDGIAALEAARVAAHTPHYRMRSIPIKKAPKAKSRQQYAPSYRIQLSDWSNGIERLLKNPAVDSLWIPLQAAAAVPTSYRAQVFLTLPRFCAAEETLITWLSQAKQLGFRHIVCENAAHIALGKSFQLHLHGGIGLRVTNHLALDFLQQNDVLDTMLSPELKCAQIRDCTGLPTGVYAYGNLPVMTCRTCPIQAELGCTKCTHMLTDRTGRAFPVACNKQADHVTIYNTVPIWMADKQSDLEGVRYLLLDCTCGADPTQILDAYQQHRTTQNPMTRGLFYRGV